LHRDQGKSGFENSFSGQKAANTAASAIASLGGFLPAFNRWVTPKENQPLTKKKKYSGNY
jgi:hypothetical protein